MSSKHTKSEIINKRKQLVKKSKSEENTQTTINENTLINSQNQTKDKKQSIQTNPQNSNKSFKDDLNPIIRERVEEYQKLHCPKEDKYGIVFGRMVNQAILEY